MVSVLELLFELHIPAVDLPSYTFGTNLGMDIKCKIEQSGSHG